MAATGYSASSATVGAVSDTSLSKPVGSGVQQITPTVPAPIAQTAAATLPTPAAPFYTKASSVLLHLTLPSAPGFTSGSLICVFWTGADGTPCFCPDCTIGISGDVVAITAPTLSAIQLAAGALYFNGATTTGAGDVSGKVLTPGTTEATFSVATIATADLPSNPDITDYSIAAANLKQLLLTCNKTGCFELLVSSTVELCHQYATAGDYYNWVYGAAAPWTGTVTAIRFYNSDAKAQVMSAGALMA